MLLRTQFLFWFSFLDVVTFWFTPVKKKRVISTTKPSEVWLLHIYTDVIGRTVTMILDKTRYYF